MLIQSKLENRILSKLSAEDFALLAEHLQPLRCPLGMVLYAENEPIRFIDFLENGIVSIVARSPEGSQAEAGIIGREGFVHPAAALGTDRLPLTLQVQVAGHAHRMPIADFVAALNSSDSLRKVMLLFAHVYSLQSSFTILSNAVQDVEERLARWLLMCHDRSESDDLPLTHKFMGVMLSVRRVSVTNALHALEAKHYVETERGVVIIRDRDAMEEFAGNAYGKSEAEYRRLLGPL